MSDEQPEPPAQPTGLQRLKADWRRLTWFAAKIGIVLAIVCHALPPHYRAPCDALARLCQPFSD